MSNPVVDRFVELMVVESYRPLSNQELVELAESFEYLKHRQWKLWKLKNMSLVAHMTNDTEWQHEICAEIERVEKGAI